MGLFDRGGSTPQQSPASQLVDQQIRQYQIETEQKRRDISKQQIEMIKSRGAQNWHAERK
jgi:hypothetical protein